MSEDVQGMTDLLEKFKNLEEAVQEDSLIGTAQAGGTVVRNAALDNIKSQGLIKTRTMSRSVHSVVIESSVNRAAVQVGTNLEYAAIHEYGGVIHPKNSKYLAIPVGTYTGSPRRHPDLKVRVTNNGNLVMVSAGGEVQYVLKQSVTIPARPYMRPAYDEQKQEVIDTMQQAYMQLIKKAVS